MMTLRCTQKLLRQLSIRKPAEVVESTNVLGDWYANLHVHRRSSFIVCMNARTLSVVLLPAKGREPVAGRFQDAVGRHLALLGVPADQVEAETRAMDELHFGATASRSILGCLREAQYAVENELILRRYETLDELALFFSGFIYSTNGYRYPQDGVRELFAAASATSAGASGASP